MFTLPIAAFFIAQYIYREADQPDNYGAAAAVLVTNSIVAAYCIKAYRDDRDENSDDDNKNDADRPRVGAFKQRTD